MRMLLLACLVISGCAHHDVIKEEKQILYMFYGEIEDVKYP